MSVAAAAVISIGKIKSGPRQKIRHLEVSDVTSSSADVTWSDDSKCTDFFKIVVPGVIAGDVIREQGSVQ